MEFFMKKENEVEENELEREIRNSNEIKKRLDEETAYTKKYGQCWDEENFIDLEFNLPDNLRTSSIAKWSAFSFLIFPAIISAIKIKRQHDCIKEIIRENERRINRKIPPEYRMLRSLEEKSEHQKTVLKSIEDSIENSRFELDEIERKIWDEKSNYSNICEKVEKAKKSEQNYIAKAAKMRELYKSIIYSAEKFSDQSFSLGNAEIPENDLSALEQVSPTVMTKLHYMDMADLRKAYRDNDKLISKVMDLYSERYTTKTNKTIYSLMVIALRSELQNVLAELKYEKLDKGLDDIKKITTKYLKIATDGNQSIANTLAKFIGEIEYLFMNAAKIEYNYYVKKEQARQEQIAIREKMREETAERKALEEERKRIEHEESKYVAEIEKMREQTKFAPADEIDKLNKRILELQSQLSNILVKKADIINIQNGKAGTVYVISNIGSFGEDVFKIGMTRRLEPQDRINELGNASVPFKFDVHSFIFSEDAVNLEGKIHELLNDRRLNKVNLRKEFFKVSLDELEELVNKIDPSAEFNRTMAAEEYRQSLSSNEVYTTDFTLGDDEDDDSEQDVSADMTARA